MDLNTLTLKELKKLRKDVDKTIADFENRKKREAMVELEKKAAEMGFSLSDLTGGKAGKIKKPSVVKYRNPADASQTWTGRGRIPLWMKAIEAAGGSRDDALI